jgi:hypothetical protein
VAVKPANVSLKRDGMPCHFNERWIHHAAVSVAAY